MGEEVADCATYEEVAAVLLHQMAAEFGVPRGDGRQTARGKAPNWEIEVNGSAVNGAMFLVVACRWHKTPHLSQAAMGGLAYRIEETGAQGGIVVRRLGVQDGDAHIAAAATMQTVHLDANQTGDRRPPHVVPSVAQCARCERERVRADARHPDG